VKGRPGKGISGEGPNDHPKDLGIVDESIDHYGHSGLLIKDMHQNGSQGVRHFFPKIFAVPTNYVLNYFTVVSYIMVHHC
jgi:hypothetical protein